MKSLDYSSHCNSFGRKVGPVNYSLEPKRGLKMKPQIECEGFSCIELQSKLPKEGPIGGYTGEFYGCF